MKTSLRNLISRLIAATLCVAAVAAVTAGLASCERIYDDLPPCPHGVKLRFVYKYNILDSNAFPAEVDCLTLFVYDAEGNYVATYTETSKILKDENYRMTLDLEEGTYCFVAYGGMACPQRSFSFVSTPAAGSQRDELGVALDSDCLTDPDRKNLHGLYYGSLTLQTADLYTEGTVEMMKDTNNIRIVLQQENGAPVNDKDFDFAIYDDNTLFAADNDLLTAGEVTYTPWTHGQQPIGVRDDGAEVVAAYAELSTSRLMTKRSPKLVVTRKSDGGKPIDILLNTYLLMLRSDRYAEMGRQEFLDRQSEWELVFILTEQQTWARTYIKINDWTVRLNDEEY